MVEGNGNAAIIVNFKSRTVDLHVNDDIAHAQSKSLLLYVEPYVI